MTETSFNGRVEDPRLLTGGGRFIDDISPAGLAHGVVLRSPHAHARIVGLDATAAGAAAGVLRVLTGADLASRGIGPLRSVASIVSRDGSSMIEPVRPILPIDQVKHAGEAVAFVVAETPGQALNAAELIEVDYQALPAAVDPEAALEPGAPRLWPEAPGNLAFDWETGDPAAVEAALAGAARRVEVRLAHPRIVVSPIEPRVAIGEYHAESESYTLHAPTQGVHKVRRALARDVLGIEEAALRVVTPDVGGSFAAKIFPYPEYALLLIAARDLGRPVKWCGTRAEAFLADAQGRARVDRATLGLDIEGRILALDMEAVADLGAYISFVGPNNPTIGGAKVLGQNYRIPAVRYRVRGVFTNAVPMDAYRGAGKPESVATMERLLDTAARETGFDRVALRRINLIRPEELPHTTAVGQTYDSGDFPALLERALALADWSGFEARRAAARAAGRLRGIGLGLYVHPTGGNPVEHSLLRANPDGTLLLLTGSQAAGQGHESVLAKIAGARLEIDPARIIVAQGDSALISTGGGTGGSSLLPVVGTTVDRAAAALIERGRAIAAHLLEAAEADIEYGAGSFRIVGTDRSLTLAAVAAEHEGLSEGLDGGCLGEADFEGVHGTYPNGAYIAEVEVDAETGETRLVGFSGVDDLGVMIEPTQAIGQLHGGLAQGIGTVLMERTHYDPATGQLLTGSFMDYQLPRADDFPAFRLEQRPEPCRSNPLGAKGAGEVGTTGAPGAVLNAVADAFHGAGLDPPELPAGPEAIWRALKSQASITAAVR